MKMWPNGSGAVAASMMMVMEPSYVVIPDEHVAREALMVDDVDLIMNKCSMDGYWQRQR